MRPIVPCSQRIYVLPHSSRISVSTLRSNIVGTERHDEIGIDGVATSKLAKTNPVHFRKRLVENRSIIGVFRLPRKYGISLEQSHKCAPIEVLLISGQVG
jgi:hypothetical protein